MPLSPKSFSSVTYSQQIAMNWTKCCLCQKDSAERLQEADYHRFPKSNGYKTLYKNILALYELRDLPLAIILDRFDEGGLGIEETIKKNNAKYHPSCFLMFSNTRVERARKRKETVALDLSKNEERAKRHCINTKGNICFICEKEASGTFEAGINNADLCITAGYCTDFECNQGH